MAKLEWNWILLVTVYGLFNEVQAQIPIGIFNNRLAAHEYQHEWLRQHKGDWLDAGEISFEAKKIMPPE
jgi:hypothetical protein